MQFIPLYDSIQFSIVWAGLVISAFVLGIWSHRIFISRSKKDYIFSDEVKTDPPPINEVLTRNRLLSQRIHFAIKNIINSNYVLTDRNRHKSLLQTPLRQTIQELRIIAETLNHNLPQASALASNCNSEDESWFDMQVLIDELKTAFTSVIDSKKVQLSLTCNIPEGLHINSNWVQGALQELVSNALKYNNDQLKVNIHLGFEKQTLVMKVQDNGQGMRATHTQMIESSRSMPDLLLRRKNDSLRPLNLHSIQQYARDHGGELHIKSARHYSTTVSLLLPLQANQYCIKKVSQPNIQPCHSSTHEQAKARASIATILLIENQQGYASAIINELERNYLVLHSTSIANGVKLLSEHKVDCILIDAESDYCDGISIESYLYSATASQDVSLILLGQNDPHIPQLKTLKVGFSAIIEKPFMPSALTVLVEHVLKERSKVQQRIESELASYHANFGNIEEIGNGAESDFVRRFNEVLSEHYPIESFSRTRAAKLLHMSDKTLGRRLAEFYNTGFSDIMKRYRLVKAKEKIRQGDKITQVAYDCGFSSPSYFTQCFRAEYGFAPSMLNKFSNCA